MTAFRECLRRLMLLSCLTFALPGMEALAQAADEPAAAATDAKPADAAASPDKPAEPAAGEAKPADAPATPPAVPPYFTGANPDPAKPLWPDPTGGSAGVWGTPAGDAKGDVPSALSLTDVYDRVLHNLFSINMVWTLITGFLVMFMQAGFSMVEGGLSRSKNACHTWSMNFMIYPLGGIGFWIYGFAIGWGNWFNGPVPPGWYASLGPGLAVLNEGAGLGADPATPGVFTYGLIGLKGFFLHGMDDISVMALFFFMMVFMDTTATIPTGAMAERWNWNNFCL
jgi:Amt family ammonium transporter